MTPYDFPPDIDSPFLDTLGAWATYDMPLMFTTLSTPVRPSLHPCGACDRMWTILKKILDRRASTRGVATNLT